MGVHGLWKLVESAGKPVPVESLDNKVLAIDVSIWLHQLMKGYQNPSGTGVSNAYLLGLFTRVCKLLFTNIKPVFVFDGGVPQLKRKTIAARQQQKNKAEQVSQKLREELLKNILKQKAVSQVLEEIRGQTSPKKKLPDLYELPPLPETEESPSDEEEMSRSSSEEDVKYKDLHSIDVNSAEFKSLPPDMRHDILSELKETRKQNSWGRIHEMPEESGDFSKYQMSRLLKRRSVQVSLEEAEKEMGGKTLSLADVETLLAEGGVEINPQLTKRIASDNRTRYIYVTETGGPSKSMGNEPLVQIKSGSSGISSATQGGLDSGLSIKKEVIDCDLLSDSELVEEVEAVERMYKDRMEYAECKSEVKNQTSIEVKEENLKFGMEDMFDNQSSSDSVDEMDLVKDNSGLSQNQILAIIKQQNSVTKNTTQLDDNMPSTSKGNTLESNLNKINNNRYLSSDSKSVSNCKSVLKQPLNTSGDAESNILDSLYLTEGVDSVKCLKRKTNCVPSKSKLPAIYSTRGGCVKSVDLSAVASNSSNSEIEAGNSLPSIKNNVVSTLYVSRNNTFQTEHLTTEFDKSAQLTSSESDDEFLQVSQGEEMINGTPNNLKNNTSPAGIRIEVQPVDHKIEDDIFADIFIDVERPDQHKTEVDPMMDSETIPPKKEMDSNTARSEKTGVVIISTKENKKNLSEFDCISLHLNEKDMEQEHLNTSSKISSGENEGFHSSSITNECDTHRAHKHMVNPSVSAPLSEIKSNLLSIDYEAKSSSLVSENKYDQDCTLTSLACGHTSDDSEDIGDPPAKSEAVKNPRNIKEKPKRKLNTKQLEKLQDILETKERELVLNHNREERMATSLTEQMYQEAQELLRLFGVPYVVAPMEAEAQCAFMDSAGLTQGTITDDSDIWLFGANNVYKNFFDQKKFVMEFKANDIQHYFRLSRGHLVLLALLVGSDYTVGLQGVGSVTAMEILAAFPPPATNEPSRLLSSLDSFKQWWLTQPRTNETLAKKLKNIDLGPGFPSTAVANAYLHPMVNDSREPFSWGQPDLPGLRDYAERKFGWSRSRTDQILQPVVNRMQHKTSQLTLHTFFGAVPNIEAQREQMSRRVQSAVNKLEGGREDFKPVQPRQRQPRRPRGRGRGSRVAAREVCLLDSHESCSGDGCNSSAAVIPQKEKDKMEALKRKQKAIEVFKNKKIKGVNKRKNLRQTKSEANLSESSSNEEN